MAGFDIYSRLTQGVTASNHAFASLMVNGVQSFFLIQLETGRAIWLGWLGEAVTGIAIPLNQ